MPRMTCEMSDKLAELTACTDHFHGISWLMLHFKSADYEEKSSRAYALLHLYGIEYDRVDSSNQRIDIELQLSREQYNLLESLL